MGLILNSETAWTQTLLPALWPSVAKVQFFTVFLARSLCKTCSWTPLGSTSPLLYSLCLRSLYPLCLYGGRDVELSLQEEGQWCMVVWRWSQLGNEDAVPTAAETSCPPPCFFLIRAVAARRGREVLVVDQSVTLWARMLASGLISPWLCSCKQLDIFHENFQKFLLDRCPVNKMAIQSLANL